MCIRAFEPEHDNKQQSIIILALHMKEDINISTMDNFLFIFYYYYYFFIVSHGNQLKTATNCVKHENAFFFFFLSV